MYNTQKFMPYSTKVEGRNENDKKEKKREKNKG